MSARRRAAVGDGRRAMIVEVSSNIVRDKFADIFWPTNVIDYRWRSLSATYEACRKVLGEIVTGTFLVMCSSLVLESVKSVCSHSF